MRQDGQVFAGEMFAPWEDSHVLDAMQSAYEEAKAETSARIADMKAALDVLGVQP